MLIPSDRPAYRLLAPFFGPNDHLFEEGECIIFAGTPNEDMEPLNEPARVKLRAYIEELDAGAKLVAEKNGRNFIKRPRSIDEMLAQASSDARQVQTMQGGPGVPLMGARKADGLIERLEPDPVPETTAKRGPGRPPGAKSRVSNDLTA